MPISTAASRWRSPEHSRWTGWAAGSSTGIEGDPSNVIGLSLPHTRALLQRVGVSVADLWAANPA